jgi:hypothetical protein
MLHYYVLNQDPRSSEVFEFLQHHQLEFEVHLNRTRFWIPPETSIATEFYLRFSNSCYLVTDH